MALTAQDVHDRQFRMVRQSTGYDIEEVDSFLEEVEAELRRLQAELAERDGRDVRVVVGDDQQQVAGLGLQRGFDG